MSPEYIRELVNAIKKKEIISPKDIEDLTNAIKQMHDDLRIKAVELQNIVTTHQEFLGKIPKPFTQSTWAGHKGFYKKERQVTVEIAKINAQINELNKLYTEKGANLLIAANEKAELTAAAAQLEKLRNGS